MESRISIFHLMKDYSQVKRLLYMRLMPENKDYLKEVPHRSFTEGSDVVITYAVLLDINEYGIQSIPITWDYLNYLGISENQLYEDALQSSPGLMPPFITVMDNRIRDFFSTDSMPLMNNHMLIVSSEHHYYGATSICYKGILERIAEEENSDLFVGLPSLNASIIIPDDGTRSAEHVKWLFRGIADSGFLEEGEILSSMLYHFDRSTGICQQLGYK